MKEKLWSWGREYFVPGFENVPGMQANLSVDFCTACPGIPKFRTLVFLDTGIMFACVINVLSFENIQHRIYRKPEPSFE
ncbi:MAG: hypothetical protein P8X96_22480 [Desulfobacteraceae bacterium]